MIFCREHESHERFGSDDVVEESIEIGGIIMTLFG